MYVGQMKDECGKGGKRSVTGVQVTEIHVTVLGNGCMACVDGMILGINFLGVGG